MTSPNRILLVLPRIDHLRAYDPLVRVLNGETALAPVVVTSVGAPNSKETTRVRWEQCAFYMPSSAGRLAWLRFAIARERAAHRIMRKIQPAAIVVPSDVADATLAFVEDACAHGVPVIYVQGTEVFPDYAARNWSADSKRNRMRAPISRLALLIANAMLPLLGVHAKVGPVGVLGSKADYIIAADDRQRTILTTAGVPADRVFVMGAPFVDRLVELAKAFDPNEAIRCRQALGAGDRPMALLLTKNVHGLRLVGPSEHRATVEAMLAAVRAVLPDCQCVVKLHPAEALEDYAWLRASGDPRITVTAEGAAEDLLLASAVAVSIGTSSAALAARFLGTPVVVMSLPQFASLDAHLALFDDEQIAQSLQTLPETLRLVCSARRDSGPIARRFNDWADGRASERITAFLHQLTTDPNLTFSGV